MFDYTRENHFRHGRHDGEWYCRYGKAQDDLSWKSALHRDARHVFEHALNPPVVLCSGGLDSEVTVRAFKESGVPFRVNIFQFETNYNIHDIAFAVALCEELGVEYQVIPFDIVVFWSNLTSIHQYARASLTFSPQMIALMRMIDVTVRQGGTPVISSGECHFVKKSGRWYLNEKERIASLYRYAEYRELEVVPAFLQYSPESILGFCRAFQSIPKNGLTDSKPLKRDVYRTIYPDIRKRPKYTGYEHVQNYDAAIRSRLLDKYQDYDGVCLTPLSELMDRLICK